MCMSLNALSRGSTGGGANIFLSKRKTRGTIYPEMLPVLLRNDRCKQELPHGWLSDFSVLNIALISLVNGFPCVNECACQAGYC